MSRFNASGRTAVRRAAIVDLPLAGGPFNSTNVATTSPYESSINPP
jgi:hypothetical protein